VCGGVSVFVYVRVKFWASRYVCMCYLVFFACVYVLACVRVIVCVFVWYSVLVCASVRFGMFVLLCS